MSGAESLDQSAIQQLVVFHDATDTNQLSVAVHSDGTTRRVSTSDAAFYIVWDSSVVPLPNAQGDVGERVLAAWQ